MIDKMTQARTYSKRHGCYVYVETVIKGRGKGLMEFRLRDEKALWWNSSVVEVVAIFKNGRKLK